MSRAGKELGGGSSNGRSSGQGAGWGQLERPVERARSWVGGPCNGFSRKLSHHTAAISLFVAHHDFVRNHGALRVTPAMEAGITDHVWSTDELVERDKARVPFQLSLFDDEA